MILMTHVVLGYPTIQESRKLIETLISSGADMLELQVPFSDPLADGPLIMRACEVALARGFRVSDTFTFVTQIKKRSSIPVYLMAYFNILFQFGVEKFCQEAQQAGVRGLIVPDMSLDEEIYEKFSFFCKKYHLENIRVVSPTTSDQRLQKNEKVASGFVYATARQGITGVRDTLPLEIQEYLQRVKKYFSIPLAVGFGISKPEHITSLGTVADIAVVGSAILQVFNTYSEKQRFEQIAHFISKLKMVK